jgi:AcrR family transcriptional regulator
MADDEKLRADARANRNHILDMVRDAADPAASLNSIAEAAGVGAGTFYRQFSSREALVLGVYRKEIDALVALAPKLLTNHPPLRAALGRVFITLRTPSIRTVADRPTHSTTRPYLSTT